MTAQKNTTKGASSKWDLLRVVLALGRGGTLSAAARALCVDHTTVARHLESLEMELAAPLFERSPLGFTPTPLGEEVLATAERMEGEVIGLLRRSEGTVSGLTGLVRLTTTPFLSARLFAPALGGFLRLHPSLQVQLVGENRTLDLSRREADVAVRMARPQVPGLVTRRLGEMAYAFYASATDMRPFSEQIFLAYEDTANDLAQENFLAKLVPPERIALRSNLTHVLIEAARAGVGCAALPCLAGEGDVSLRRVPSPRSMQSMPLWLAYHEDLRRSPRVRVITEFIERVVTGNSQALVPEDLSTEHQQARHKKGPMSSTP